MPPLKVLHLITSLERGGAQTMLVKLVQHCDRARIAPVVASLLDDGANVADLRAAGVPVFGLGMGRGGISPAALLRLVRLVRAERPQILQTWLYHADLLGLAVSCVMPRLPLLWNLRCSEMEDYPLRNRAVRRVLAWASPWPAAVLVNSEAGRRYHAALGYRPRRWELVENGFDIEIFRPDAQRRAAWRQRLGVNDTQPLVGMVARVDPMKDHATFLAAAAALVAAGSPAAFLLVGAGTETLTDSPALAGRLHALGERGDVADLLPALDVMALPSAYGEGFPNAVGEAMACGVPCVASDVGDAAAIIGDTGAIVPPRDPRALASAIASLLSRGPAGLAQLGLAARQRILAHYSLSAVVAHYQRIYEEAARASGSTSAA